MSNNGATTTQDRSILTAPGEPLSDEEAAKIEAHVSQVLEVGCAMATEARIARDVEAMLAGPLFKGIRKRAVQDPAQ